MPSTPACVFKEKGRDSWTSTTSISSKMAERIALAMIRCADEEQIRIFLSEITEQVELR